MCMMSKKSESVQNAETRLEQIRKQLKGAVSGNESVLTINELKKQEADASAQLVNALVQDKITSTVKVEMASRARKAQEAASSDWWWNRLNNVGASMVGLCLDAGEVVGLVKAEDAAAERRQRREALMAMDEKTEQLQREAEAIAKVAATA